MQKRKVGRWGRQGQPGAVSSPGPAVGTWQSIPTPAPPPSLQPQQIKPGGC